MHWPSRQRPVCVFKPHSHPFVHQRVVEWKIPSHLCIHIMILQTRFHPVNSSSLGLSLLTIWFLWAPARAKPALNHCVSSDASAIGSVAEEGPGCLGRTPKVAWEEEREDCFWRIQLLLIPSHKTVSYPMYTWPSSTSSLVSSEIFLCGSVLVV